MSFRPEYIEALSLLAQVCEDVVERGCERPVLVGGAAVEFYTGGDIVSRDFDFVIAKHEEVFGEALRRHGFTLVGCRSFVQSFRHPKRAIAVDVIRGTLFSGTDANRIRPIEIAQGKWLAILPIEDLIADRLEQYRYSVGVDAGRKMFDQAISLLKAQHYSMRLLHT